HLLRLDELRLEGLQLGGIREYGEDREPTVELGAGEGDLQEDLLPAGRATRHLRAAEGAAACGVGQPFGYGAAEAFDQGGDVDAGLHSVPEELARGTVGIDQLTVGLEPGECYRQLFEEVVGDEAGDLGVTEWNEQQVAVFVFAVVDDGAHRLARCGEGVHAA